MKNDKRLENLARKIADNKNVTKRLKNHTYNLIKDNIYTVQDITNLLGDLAENRMLLNLEYKIEYEKIHGDIPPAIERLKKDLTTVLGSK